MASYELRGELLPDDLKVIKPKDWTVVQVKQFLKHRLDLPSGSTQYDSLVEGGVKAELLFESTTDELEDLGFSRIHALLIVKTKGGDGGGAAARGGGISGPDAWVKASGFPPIKLDERLVRIPVNYLLDSGLGSDNDALLFRREEFDLQITTLNQKVLVESQICWVLGPPGCGKSCTTFAWVSSLSRSDWVVTWVQLRRTGKVLCVRLINEGKWTTRLKKTQSESFEIILAECDSMEEHGQKKGHIVVLDGFVRSESSHREWADVCYDWRNRDKIRRRLVIDCSMTVRGKVSEGEELADKVCEHFVNSWKSNEYTAAMKCDGFFAHVKQSLDASAQVELPPGWANPNDILTEPSRSELLRSKEYFAGASARYMFDMNTASVVRCINLAIESLRKLSSTRDGDERMRSEQTINRLFRCYASHVTGQLRNSLISSFAASELAVKLGPDALSKVMQTLPELNPAMQGWIMEMMFFQRLVHGGVSVKATRGKKEVWKQAGNVVLCDTSNAVSVAKDGCYWIKPLKWNQGGYDAAYIESGAENVVRFVQVTMGRTHSLKLQYLWTFLKKLHEGSEHFTIDKVQICFVVPAGRRGSFRIKDVIAEGILAEYGWAKGQERENAAILEVEVGELGLWEGWPESDNGETSKESEGEAAANRGKKASKRPLKEERGAGARAGRGKRAKGKKAK